MLHGRNAANSLHISKFRPRRSAEKNCSEAGSYYSCLAYDEWKKKGAGGDREHRKTIMVAIEGTLDARTGYPVQNLRASLRGTRISTTSAELFEPGQELLFLGRWWLIDDVSLDVSDYAPQSAAVNGTGHPKTFLDIIGQQAKGVF